MERERNQARRSSSTSPAPPVYATLGQDHPDGRTSVTNVPTRPSATSEDYIGPSSSSTVSIQNIIDRQTWETRKGISNSFDPERRGFEVSRNANDYHRGGHGRDDRRYCRSRSPDRDRYDYDRYGQDRHYNSRSNSLDNNYSRGRDHRYHGDMGRSDRDHHGRHDSSHHRHHHHHDGRSHHESRSGRHDSGHHHHHDDRSHHASRRGYDDYRHHGRRYGDRRSSSYDRDYRGSSASRKDDGNSKPSRHGDDVSGDDGWETVQGLSRGRHSPMTQAPGQEEERPHMPHYVPPTDLNTKFEKFLILLVGVPGSGKSTFAEALETAMPYKYVRINQDTLGNRRRCEDVARRVLADGKCAVIDRCNFDKDQRKHFLDIAKEANAPVDAVVFTYPMEVCLRRCENRTNHETIPKGQEREVVERMVKNFSPPLPNRVTSENFRELKNVTDVGMFNDLVLEYLNLV